MREALEQRTEQRLQQSLSPLQLLYSRTLEMNGPEFEDEVRRVVDDNPALEVVDDAASLSLPEADPETSFNETADQLMRADYRSEEDVPSYRLNGSPTMGADSVLEATAQNQMPSLAERLEQQLAELELSSAERALATYLIGDIDDNGYLTRTPRQIADDLAFNVGVDVDEQAVEEALKLVQSLDPPGVGAQSLQQSLELQLQRLNPSDERVSDALNVVRNHFSLFTHKHFDRIAAAADISAERARVAVELIRSLNPKPGAPYDNSDERTRHIYPDFEIEPVGDDRHLTLSMPNTVPQLRIEAQFDLSDAELERGRRSGSRAQAEAMTFIKRKRDEASEFIRAMQMRHDTLWRVMTAIMQHQSEFFLTGDTALLRPMILKDVADMTSLDLSVISRATAGKYVATPSGVYPLKFFFNEKPKEELDASSHAILDALRQIIEKENKHKPFSDDKLSALLRDQGMDIARRTVTKYRERLGFPVARLRREL